MLFEIFDPRLSSLRTSRVYFAVVSAITSITSLSALIAILFVEKRAKRRAAQSQSVAENAIGIQAGGNVKVGNIHANRD